MESSNVVFDDERLKTIDHEEEITRDDNSPLEKVVVTLNVETPNLDKEVTQLLVRVPLLDSNEPAPWVRKLHNKDDIIGDVNKVLGLGVE